MGQPFLALNGSMLHTYRNCYCYRLIIIAITFVVEKFSVTRIYATNILGFLTWFLGIFTVLSFNELSSFTIFGMTIFDNLDYLTSKIMLPLGGLLMALFVGYVMNRAIVKKELHANQGIIDTWFMIIKQIQLSQL